MDTFLLVNAMDPSSFSWYTTLRKMLCFTTEKMYSALLFSRKNLLCNDVVIDVKCVICWDLHTHLEVRGFLSDMRVACMHVFRS